MADRGPRARQYPSSGSFELFDVAHVIRGAGFAKDYGYCRRFTSPGHVTLHLFDSGAVEAMGWVERREAKRMELRRLPAEWADAFVAEWLRLRPDGVVKDKRARGWDGPADFSVRSGSSPV